MKSLILKPNSHHNQMTSSSPKYALVTGGNRIIGLAICQGLAQAGFVTIVAARSLDKAHSTCERLPAATTYPLELDIADDTSIDRAATQIQSKIGKLDVLVNHAGIYPDLEGIDILNIDRQLLDRAMQTNTYGAIRTTQALLPLLKQATAARIINVTSGLGALDGLSATAASYCLSKLALNGATIMRSASLKPHGMAVYSMCPGWVKKIWAEPMHRARQNRERIRRFGWLLLHRSN